MKLLPQNNLIGHIVQELTKPTSYEGLYHQPSLESPMPSVERIKELVERLRAVLFPGYYGFSRVTPENMPFYIGAELEKIRFALIEQITCGICFFCTGESETICDNCSDLAKEMADTFIFNLLNIRHLLATDVQAAFAGDPAARTPGETIFCYPSIRALTNYRIAHALHKQGVHLIPRIITELAHSETGIDIHPGATIDEFFFMDHGTGIVIGETCIIGKNVRLYQGVTLGAKSFSKDKNGFLVKGEARHPIVKDNVIIYAGATILGRITIGKGASIGGNAWVTHDVAEGEILFSKQ